jgi:histone H3/H4
MAEAWLKCSACRKEIAFGGRHWVCSVSTCNRSRTRLVFCSVPCWDSHVATLRHRDAYAVEATAPTQEAWQKELASQDPAPTPTPVARITPVQRAVSGPIPRPGTDSDGVPRPKSPTGEVREETRPNVAPPPPAVRRVVGDASPATAAAAEGVKLADVVDKDILIVVSKMKKYIRDRSGFNCSDAVAEVLSDHVRAICDDSIRAAGRDGRKTVLDRDVPRPRR